jgi:DNA-binding transcriptional MerR regulator
MLIQEFCRATGLSRDTVRFYVRRGLLAPAIGAPARASTAADPSGRPSNRYRVFDAAQVERARLIRAAQTLGFTLREIAALAAAYEKGRLTAARKAEVLRAQLAELDARATRLATLRRYLGQKLAWVEAGEVGTPPRLETPAAPDDEASWPHAATSRPARGRSPRRALGPTAPTGPTSGCARPVRPTT